MCSCRCHPHDPGREHPPLGCCVCCPDLVGVARDRAAREFRALDEAEADRRVRHAVAVLRNHQVALLPLVSTARDIELATARRPDRLLLPATWKLPADLVDGGTYFGYQLLVTPGIDRPLLGYSSP